MKITKKQLKRIIKEEKRRLEEQGVEVNVDKEIVDRIQALPDPTEFEDMLDQVRTGDMELADLERELAAEEKAGGMEVMEITKRQLKRIVREATDEVKVDNNTHHWPRVDWTNVEELTDKWAQGERDAFDKGDPVMMGMGETYNESKGIWDMQVENAAMDMENELTDRVRKVALQTMKEFTDRLIEGEYA